MNYAHLDLLLRLIAAHVITDFFLHPKTWIEERHKKKIKSPKLYLHSLITGAFAYIALGSWYPVWIPVIITISHFVFDLVKSYKDEDSTTYFVIDQILHVMVIFVCWLIFTTQVNLLYTDFIVQYYNPKLWFFLTAYIIVTIPASIIITKLTAKWSSEIYKDANIESLKNAGKWIGIIERILVLTFTLSGQYEAIGFLLAAKSVFRFGDLNNAADRKRTEYILIGTLISFSVSIITGIIIHKISQGL